MAEWECYYPKEYMPDVKVKLKKAMEEVLKFFKIKAEVQVVEDEPRIKSSSGSIQHFAIAKKHYDIFEKEVFPILPLSVQTHILFARQEASSLKQQTFYSEHNGMFGLWGLSATEQFCRLKFAHLDFLTRVLRLLKSSTLDKNNIEYLDLFIYVTKNGYGASRGISERTVLVHLHPIVRYDEIGQLHCEDGPAVKYLLFKKFYWHGDMVSESYITRKPSLKDIFNENDSLRNDLLLPKYGYERFREDMKSRIISHDRTGTLYKIEDAKTNLVLVSCPTTKKQYLIPVPKSVKSARNAVAWTFSMRGNRYKPICET